MANTMIIPLIGGLTLFASLMLLLFAFAHLRDREQARSMAANLKAIQSGDTTNSPSPSPALSIGRHYITDERMAAQNGGGSPVGPRTTGMNDNTSGATTNQGGGLTISGFDSVGSKVFLTLSHAEISARRWGVTLGRDETLSDYVVRDQDNYVSRRHLRIHWNPDDRCYEVEDLASTSGTLLDNRKIEPWRTTTIRPGSTVKIGRLELDIGKA